MKRYDPSKSFTREMLFEMTQEEVIQFWKDKQRYLRDKGYEHYTKLIDPVTDEIVAEI